MKADKSINEIITSYINGASHPDDLNGALSLFEEPHQNLNLRCIIFDWWNDEKGLEKQPLPSDLSEILDKVHHRINLEQNKNRKNKGRQLLLRITGIAAILIVGVVFGFFVHHFLSPGPVYYTSIAPKGSISQLILPDNTMVYLNSGSELKYNVSGNNKLREVYLDGEAWFDVAKNQTKPFVVHTPFFDIRVLGTQFNVKAYKSDNEIITTLEEGKIEVLPTERTFIKEHKTLEPGEQLVYNALKKQAEIKHVNPRVLTSWKDNKVIFINMDLKELIVLLERKYGVEIDVRDNKILNYHYDGTIKDETILEVLDLIKETLPIRYKIDGQTIIIQKN